MEPDKDEWLPHRILRVEREPVPWDKTEVWERIDDELRPAGLRRYNVAAAITAILLSLSYFTIDDTADSIKLPDVITENQSGSAETITEQSEKPTEVPLEQKVANTVRKTKPEYASKENNPFRETPANIVSIQTTVPPVSDTVDLTDMPPVGVVAAEIRDVSEEKIRPVIGVVYSGPSPQSMANNKRRKKLYKLEAGGTEPWTPPLSNTVILAGKK